MGLVHVYERCRDCGNDNWVFHEFRAQRVRTYFSLGVCKDTASTNLSTMQQGGGKKKAKQQQRQQNEEGPCYDNVMCWWCLVRCCPCPQDVKKCRQGDEIWVGSSVPSPHPPPEGVSASTRSRMFPLCSVAAFASVHSSDERHTLPSLLLSSPQYAPTPATMNTSPTSA